MATWDATTSNSTFDANIAAQTAMDARSASRSGAAINSSFGATKGGIFGIGAKAGQTAQSMGGYSIVGIDANRIPEMRDQIRNSVQAIQSHLDGIEAETNSSNAFRSDDIKNAVQQYVLSVKEYSKALISDLLAFSDKLQDVRNAWEQSTASYASESIGASTTGMKDSATYYTESL